MDDPEDRELGRHLRKRGEWRILVDRQVRSGTGRALQVRLQHGRTVVGRDLFQAYRLVSAMVEGDATPRYLHVLHPANARPQHGYQIALTGNNNHDER
jgi:hypothetical protein